MRYLLSREEAKKVDIKVIALLDYVKYNAFTKFDIKRTVQIMCSPF